MGSTIRDALMTTRNGKATVQKLLVVEVKAKADRVKTLDDLVHYALCGRRAIFNQKHRCKLPVFHDEGGDVETNRLYRDTQAQIAAIAAKGGDEYNRLCRIFKYAPTGYKAMAEAIDQIYDLVALQMAA